VAGVAPALGREDRERLAQLAGGIGTFELDLASGEWRWTPQVAVLFGFDPARPQPPVEEWERSIFGDDALKLRAAVEAAQRSGTYYVEFRVRHPDGGIHWLAGKGTTAADRSGRPRWLCGAYYDISDRKALEARLLALNETLEARVAEIQREVIARREAEQELQRINETLEDRVAAEIAHRQQVEDTLRQAQKMETIGQLTGGIAHDFNNLLTVITGNLEHAQLRLPADHGVQHMLAAALRGASRAALLTQRLLVFSRRQPLVPQVISINRLVAGMSDLLGRTIGEAVAIETVLAGGLWPAFVDVNQLENALINLAVNARDAMPGGGKLTIETANCHLDEAYAAMEGGVRPGEYVGIFLSDTGVGMPEEIASKAFEPFFTTKDVGHGTGLGLSQVYGFVKQSGGHVKIYTEPGHGTTVKLYFPRHDSAGTAAEAQPSPAAAPQATPGETVLVVEDDPDVRSFTTEMVGKLGYRVLVAENGTAALRTLETNPGVHVLFTDVGLPGGMNGRQLADEAMRRRPGLKVLFTTGYARNAIVHHGRLDPGVEVVFKPFTTFELATKLRRVLDG
jgi:signal transduction histidine kinase/CheY-like chemotaxis protein